MTPLRRPASALAVVLIAATILSGCGAADEPEGPGESEASATPTVDVDVPAGVELTEPGTDLSFGEVATVAYKANEERSTVLEINVTEVTQGAISDLGGYVLDDRTKASTPYYVAITVKNVGTGDVGRTPIPLWAVDGDNTLIQASSFTNTFKKCPSKPFPTTFAPNATTDACLMYLIPESGELTGVSFRPLQEVAPIEWTGEITVPKTKKKS